MILIQEKKRSSNNFTNGSIYSGRSNLDIWDQTDSDWAWYIYFNDMTTSSAIYNQDGQAVALVPGHIYEWDVNSFGFDINGKLIAYSWSEYWDFYYGNIVADVGACAITLPDVTPPTSIGMSEFQDKIAQLQEKGILKPSCMFDNKSKSSIQNSTIPAYMIRVDWHSYYDATGYRVYKSINGAGYVLVIEWEAPTGYDRYGFYDEDVIPGNTYTYYVTAYGTDWETDPSEIVTIDTFLPPCSLISPLDGATITYPNPVFEWSPVGVSSFPYVSIYEGDSDLWVYDDTGGWQVWWRIFYDNMTVSTITYNDDGQAYPLVSGHNYLWNSWGYGYDDNWNLIAMSWSGDWMFTYTE